MENKQLPDGLKEEFDGIKNAIKQWSKLVAWSWTDFLAFQGDPKLEKELQEEKKLKAFFRQFLQDQARYRYAVSSYEDETQKGYAYIASLKIKKLVMNKNEEIQELKEAKVTLTLKDVYLKLAGEDTKIFSDENLMQKFHMEIVTDRFSGYIRDILDSEKLEVIEAIINNSESETELKIDLKYVKDVQYISYFAYPPCPALGEATVTKKQLEDWMQVKSTEDTGEYLPPSAYMPISLT